jgi:hypothetical protein
MSLLPTDYQEPSLAVRCIRKLRYILEDGAFVVFYLAYEIVSLVLFTIYSIIDVLKHL